MTVKRFITQWPFNMQPLPGCSGVDWNKVEVVPAVDYDALCEEQIKLRGLAAFRLNHIEQLEAALRDIKDGNADNCGDCRFNEQIAEAALGGRWSSDPQISPRCSNMGHKRLKARCEKLEAALRVDQHVTDEELIRIRNAGIITWDRMVSTVITELLRWRQQARTALETGAEHDQT